MATGSYRTRLLIDGDYLAACDIERSKFYDIW